MRIAVSLVAVLCTIVGNLWSQVQRKDVDIKAPDGLVLKGTYLSPGKAGPAMLLIHQCNMDRRAWDAFADDLAGAGIHVLTFDLRGFGQTGGELPPPPPPPPAAARGGSSRLTPALPESLVTDVEAAYSFLLSQKGVDKNRVAAGGASCGVTLSADLAMKHGEIKALLLMSGSVSDPAKSSIASKPAIAVFGTAAQNDRDSATAIEEAVRASKNPRSTLKIYQGAEHGVPMFTKNPDLKPMILKWLQTELR